MNMIRVDFNKPGGNMVWLVTFGSREDLARIPDVREGMRLIVYESNELEVQATLASQPARRHCRHGRGLPVAER